jgi:hypothetical protein
VKPELKFALFILGLSVIWKTGLLIAGFESSAIAKYPLIPVMAFMLIGMFRQVDYIRKDSVPSSISSIALFKSGMSTGVLFSLMYTLFIYVYLTFLDSGFKQRFMDARIAELIASNTPETDIQAWASSAAQFPFVMSWVLFTFVFLLLISLIYALLIARMMKRKFGNEWK